MNLGAVVTTNELQWCNRKHCSLRPHVANCRECFGFGLKGNDIPITAEEVTEWWVTGKGGIIYDGVYTICPACGGSPFEDVRVSHAPIELTKVNM